MGLFMAPRFVNACDSNTAFPQLIRVAIIIKWKIKEKKKRNLRKKKCVYVCGKQGERPSGGALSHSFLFLFNDVQV